MLWDGKKEERSTGLLSETAVGWHMRIDLGLRFQARDLSACLGRT